MDVFGDSFDVSDIDDASTDCIIDPIENNEYSIAYGLFDKLLSYAYHYNLSKRKCKAISTAWLIATFAGYGYLVTNRTSLSPSSNLPALVLISLLAAFGIFLVQFLDVAVYHRLIEAIVVEQLKIEEQHPNLCHAVRIQNRLLNRLPIGPVFFDGLFYSSLVLSLLSVAIIGTIAHWLSNKNIEALILIISIASLIIVLFAILITQSKYSSAGSLFKKSQPHKDKK